MYVLAQSVQPFPDARYGHAAFGRNLLPRQTVDVVQHGDRSRRFRMSRKQPIEQEPRVARGGRFFEARDCVKTISIRILRTPGTIAQPVQTHVRGHPVEEARWITRVQSRAPLDEAEKHVLACIEGLVVVAEQTTAAPQHHWPIAAAQGADVQLLPHAMGVTPMRRESVTPTVIRMPTTDPRRARARSNPWPDLDEEQDQEIHALLERFLPQSTNRSELC